MRVDNGGAHPAPADARLTLHHLPRWHRRAKVALSDGGRDRRAAQHTAAHDEHQPVQHGQRRAAKQRAVVVGLIGPDHVHYHQRRQRIDAAVLHAMGER